MAASATQDHPYVTSTGTLLEDFESTTGWTLAGTGATVENNTSLFKQGSQSIKLNTVNGVEGNITKTVNWDMSTGDGFSFWYYTTDAAKLSYVILNLSSGQFVSPKFKSELYLSYLQNGWNYIVLSKADFTNVSSDNWNSARIRIQFRVIPLTGQNASVSFDDFRFGLTGHPKVILSFDDSYASQVTKALPIMTANSQRGVSFTVTQQVNIGAYITTANLQTLKSAGWDVSNHTAAHTHLAGESQGAMEADIDDGYDWLVANGFGATAKFFAYPFGEWNDAVVTKLKERHVLSRTVGSSDFGMQFDISNFEDLQYKLKGYVVNASVAVATVEAEIDSTIAKGGVLTLYLHDIVDAGATGTQTLTANFQAISDYLKTKQDVGLLDVITFSDYYNALTADWITVNPTSGLTTTEAGGTDTFTVVLTSQPTADVIIGLSSSDTTEGLVSPSSLTFTSANYNTPQTVTVTGVDDSVVDGNIAYTVVTAAVSSSDPNYDDLNPSDVSVTNSDNDTPTPTPTPARSSSGTSVSNQIQNLIALGNIQAADKLKLQYPGVLAPIPTEQETLLAKITELKAKIAALSGGNQIASGPRNDKFLTRSWSFGQQGTEVKQLQQFLNTHGFSLAKTGPGSLGKETTMFGYATKAAVIRFQKANKISPIGIVGPQTRAKILLLIK